MGDFQLTTAKHNDDAAPPTPALHGPEATAARRFEIPAQRKISVWTILGVLFLAGTLVTLLSVHGTRAGQDMGVSFVSIILEAMPFVMIGSLLGGLFEVFVSREWVIRILPKRKIYAVLLAGLLGLMLPVCECAVIPFTRRLVRKGVPFSTAVAYLLAGPIINVLVGTATLMAYQWNWHIVAARMTFGYVVAVSVALVIDRWFPGQTALLDPGTADPVSHACACGHDHGCDADEDEEDHGHEPEHSHTHDCECGHDHDHGHEETHAHDNEPSCECGHDHEHAHEHHEHNDSHVAAESIWKRLADATNHACDDFLQVGQFLVVGAFIASICQTVIPRHMLQTVAGMPVLAIMLMMGLAVALNLCSGADAFVAASFRSFLPLSAQMGFMVLGPMLDLKLSAMYLSFIRKRAFVALVVLMYSFVFTLMILWHYFFVAGVH